uniref:Dihydroorotase n=1 Tax=Panagrellus redivivus TaxID=6233 RepID=A0A7E4W6S1_PANRE
MKRESEQRPKACTTHVVDPPVGKLEVDVNRRRGVSPKVLGTPCHFHGIARGYNAFTALEPVVSTALSRFSVEHFEQPTGRYSNLLLPVTGSKQGVCLNGSVLSLAAVKAT